jgi:hypothetical protein
MFIKAFCGRIEKIAWPAGCPADGGVFPPASFVSLRAVGHHLSSQIFVSGLGLPWIGSFASCWTGCTAKMLLEQPALQGCSDATLCRSLPDPGCGNDFGGAASIQAISSELIHMA